nr:MAG TPA_asm: collagen alpha 1(VIII) chain protein [Caudoviricetes sp.]
MTIITTIQMPTSTIRVNTPMRVTLVGTGTRGPQGLPGIQGPPGDAGPGGGSDAYYEHNQAVPSDVWTVTHNLGKRPAVTIIDSAGDEVEGSVKHDTLNQLTITFSAGFAGMAFLN